MAIQINTFTTIFLLLVALFFCVPTLQAQGDFNYLQEPIDTQQINIESAALPQDSLEDGSDDGSDNNLNDDALQESLQNNFQNSDTLQPKVEVNQNTSLPRIEFTDTGKINIDTLQDLKTETNPTAPTEPIKYEVLNIGGGISFPAFALNEIPTVYNPIQEKAEKIINRNKQTALEHTVVFYVFCVIIFIFALTRIWFLPYINNLFRSFQNIRAARIQYEDTSYRDTTPQALLLINTVLVFSLMVYWFVTRYFEKSDNPMLLWIGCFFIFMLIFVLRIFFIKASARVFPISNTMNYYFFNLQLINMITAWFLTPFLMVALYVEGIPKSIMAAILLTIWLFFVLFRIFRGYKISQKIIVNYPFYFFIYLCTLEISPLLVIYKFFVKI